MEWSYDLVVLFRFVSTKWQVIEKTGKFLPLHFPNRKMKAQLFVINHMILPCLWAPPFTSKGAKKKNKFGLIGTQGLSSQISIYNFNTIWVNLFQTWHVKRMAVAALFVRWVDTVFPIAVVVKLKSRTSSERLTC